jgi:hypothetical protein
MPSKSGRSSDARNQQSRTALERIGGRFEGVLRAHRMAADYTARNSLRYSIVVSEWPAVKERLGNLLDQVSTATELPQPGEREKYGKTQ